MELFIKLIVKTNFIVGMSSRKGKEKEASSSGTKHPPRGPNKYMKPPDTPEERPVIRRVGYR